MVGLFEDVWCYNYAVVCCLFTLFACFGGCWFIVGDLFQLLLMQARRFWWVAGLAVWVCVLLFLLWVVCGWMFWLGCNIGLLKGGVGLRCWFVGFRVALGVLVSCAWVLAFVSICLLQLLSASCCCLGLIMWVFVCVICLFGWYLPVVVVD